MLWGSGFAATPPPWITGQVATSARETLRTFAPASQTLRRVRTYRRALGVCAATPWRPIQGLLSCVLCYLECKERWPALCSSIGVALEEERSSLER